MAQELRLKVNDEPTWFNKEMVIGTLIMPFIGTFIGGYIGKERMEREKKEGRAVSEKPDFWNKDALLGGAIGYALSGVVAAFAGGATALAGLGLVIATGSPEVVAGAGILTALATVAGMVAAPVIGAYIGGKHGEKTQAAEYEQAKQQQIVQHLSHNVSPEVAQAVEYRMAHDKQWGKQILEEKLLATAQEQAR